MSERWVPVAPEDIRVGDTLRFVDDPAFMRFEIGWFGQDADPGRMFGVTTSDGTVRPDDYWWVAPDTWERLESDTANLNSDAPNSSFEPADLNSVTLPEPHEPLDWRWRRVPNHIHDAYMSQSLYIAGKPVWRRYRELNQS